MTDEDPWLSSTEAAKRLGVTPRTLYRLINDAEIAGYKMGRVIRLRESDVVAYLDKARIKPGALDHLLPESAADTSSE